MNKERRKEIENAIASLDEVLNNLSSATEDVESILGDEEEYRDNIPENLQGSERYEIACEAIDTLEEAMDSLNSAVDAINDAISELNSAMEG